MLPGSHTGSERLAPGEVFAQLLDEVVDNERTWAELVAPISLVVLFPVIEPVIERVIQVPILHCDPPGWAV